MAPATCPVWKNVTMAPYANGFETIRDLLSTHFDDVDTTMLTPHVTFESLGLDSLGLMEMLVVVHQRLGVTLSELGVDLSSALTVGDVAAALDRHIHSAQGSTEPDGAAV
ncbi:acyl carrier protein [Streptomyces sp. NPDC058874]|uniref:acyl carrier protein n=1 Tax=unclassified Streptomyces TaxID=2593676 RepID=UPI0036AEC36D